MAVAPKIDRSTITVVVDELAGTDSDRGKVVVVGGGGDKRGARSEEGDVEGPQVLEWWANRESRVEADERPVGIGSSMERCDEGVGEMADGVKDLLGYDKEEGVVGEEGDDEDIDEEDAVENRELTNHGLGSGKTRKGLGVRNLEDILKGDVTADGDTEVCCDRAKRKERPGAGEEGGAEGCVGRRRRGGDDAAFVSIDTETGKIGELRDEEEGRGDNLNGGGSEGEIIRKGIRRDTRECGDTREERVVGDDEEERRERATLFDTPKNVDPVGEVPSKGGGNPNIL